MKFLVEINPEFDETPEELQALIAESLRDNALYGAVTIIPE